VSYIQANHLSSRENVTRQRVGGAPTNWRRRRALLKKIGGVDKMAAARPGESASSYALAPR